MHALAMKELLIGVKWYMNESDKKCYSRYSMSLKFLSRYHTILGAYRGRQIK